jgi:hypothetical protein
MPRKRKYPKRGKKKIVRIGTTAADGMGMQIGALALGIILHAAGFNVKVERDERPAEKPESKIDNVTDAEAEIISSKIKGENEPPGDN